MYRTKVRVVEDALDANNTIARANRDDFDRSGVRVVNLMSAPGAGKTALWSELYPGCVRWACSKATSRELRRRPPVASARAGGSAQHRSGLRGRGATSTPTWCARPSPTCPSTDIDLLVIENVGNLVCPAEFRVGEDVRAMIASVAEGEDKPLKYPLMFRACELVVVNKIDLLPHVDFDLDRFLANLEAGEPGVAHMLVSARTGEGVSELRTWLERVAARRPLRRDRGWPRSTSWAPASRSAIRRTGISSAPRRSGRQALPRHGRALRGRRAAARARRARRPRGLTCVT